MSELKLEDIKKAVDATCPIKIYINGNVVWDDNYDSIKLYDYIFTMNYIVKEIKFKVVSFHHTIVKIKVKKGK